MLEIKLILCPIDFSEYWVRAYHYALSLAEHYRAKLVDQLALEAQDDLVIMAVRGRDSLDLAVFGSTTYRVMQLGPCPVLVVHV